MAGNDTIAAVSTAPGEGGIGVIRISGDRAAEILGALFRAPGKQPGEKVFGNRVMRYGHILDPSTSETVDEALVVYMKGPHSYTGEDVCEIQCHGGGMPLRRILDLVCSLGAAPAQPGEFTKRAFLNGRLDLVQAGAVIDLIRSKTGRGYHAAKEQAEGRLSERVRAIREILLGALAEIAARIDYPEAFEEEGHAEAAFFGGDTGNGGGGGLDEALASAASGTAELIKSAEAGRLVRDGVRAVIIGKPNTGKSSLFNAFAREDAAIVTATPGTTRDAIEVWLDIRGVPVLMVDTAGIRESEDGVESLGIERAKEQCRKADVTIFLLDSGVPLSEEDRETAKLLDPEKKLILTMGKSDLPQAFGTKEAVSILPFPYPEKDVVRISLLEDGLRSDKEKVGEIERLIGEYVMGGDYTSSSLLVTKARHKVLLERAASEIAEARTALAAGAAAEFAEVSIRAAWDALGEMTGETSSDDVIDRVFEEFCIGK